MSNKTLVITVVIVILLFVGTVGATRYFNGRHTGPSPDEFKVGTQTNPTSTPQTLNTCQREFNQQKLQTAKVDIKNRQVEIEVRNFGKIKVAFYEKDAPKTVENFLRLTNAGYFNCVTFHRIAKGFVIQGGDPTGTGSGGDSAFGKEFADELNPTTASFKTGYVKGTLAMANRGPNTNTSQFFILLADAPQLPKNYTIFGHVIEGQNVVDKIGQVEIEAVLGPQDGKPKIPVVMESVKIVK